ncbi:MAG: DUF4190 domain-containing protein [Flavobacteriales bacterium]
MSRFAFARIALLLFACVILLSACTTDRHVVTGGLIQKRKYRPGWNVDLGFRNDRTPVTNRTTVERMIPVRRVHNKALVAAQERSIAVVRTSAPITASIAPLRIVHPLTRLHLLRAAILPERIMATQDGEENLMPKKKWNVLAVPVFVLALGSLTLGFLTTSTLAVLLAAVVTVALGAIALRHIRSHDEAGKGFALIGFIIGLFVLLFVGISIATAGWAV